MGRSCQRPSELRCECAAADVVNGILDRCIIFTRARWQQSTFGLSTSFNFGYLESINKQLHYRIGFSQLLYMTVYM